ncbi:MAG: SMC-Scp complex subunit ScpB [Bacillota bacterium]
MSQPMTEPTANPRSALEALLLAAPGPARLESLAEALGLEPGAVEALLRALAEEYDQAGRGFALQAVAGGYRLVTRPEFAGSVNRFLKGPALPTLTMATLETLSIVAYRQPVTRVDIEAIRGVRVDKALSTLLERGLLRELGRKEGIGRPILYGTTPLFLEHFGLAGLGALPGLEDMTTAEEAATEAAPAGEAGEASEEARPTGEQAPDSGPEDPA